jgi:hypothetical protein
MYLCMGVQLLNLGKEVNMQECYWYVDPPFPPSFFNLFPPFFAAAGPGCGGQHARLGPMDTPTLGCIPRPGTRKEETYYT